MPILKEDYSTHQSEKLWRQSEDSSRIPTTCICRSWVGTLFRIIQKGQFSRGITSIQSVVKELSIQYSLDNSIHPYRPHSINQYGLGPIGPFHIPLCEFHHTVQISRWPELYFPIRTIK
ncbi:hypothetical protein O181_120767 [Austropuccinia psidii MF-1]|uniref:Uncharacterized protein n=1 Tax=Austropuccinia psidii MF-1 TaxID=1389203 RepID=A0A9Q3KHM6_9BASI|nr:hypothetical protein [Austropuccinia psidii MF-1]